MNFAQGSSVIFRDTPYEMLFFDQHSVMLCQLDDQSKREHITRTDFDEAYLAGEVAEYGRGFSPDEWATNRVRSRDLTSLEFASEAQRRTVKYRLPYAEYFYENRVSRIGQEDVCAMISKENGHTTSPTASTARRWAARYARAKANPSALIDSRAKKPRDEGDET